MMMGLSLSALSFLQPSSRENSQDDEIHLPDNSSLNYASLFSGQSAKAVGHDGDRMVIFLDNLIFVISVVFDIGGNYRGLLGAGAGRLDSGQHNGEVCN
jgi:hypothetical protein